MNDVWNKMIICGVVFCLSMIGKFFYDVFKKRNYEFIKIREATEFVSKFNEKFQSCMCLTHNKTATVDELQTILDDMVKMNEEFNGDIMMIEQVVHSRIQLIKSINFVAGRIFEMEMFVNGDK